MNPYIKNSHPSTKLNLVLGCAVAFGLQAMVFLLNRPLQEAIFSYFLHGLSFLYTFCFFYILYLISFVIKPVVYSIFLCVLFYLQSYFLWVALNNTVIFVQKSYNDNYHYALLVLKQGQGALLCGVITVSFLIIISAFRGLVVKMLFVCFYFFCMLMFFPAYE